MMSNKIQEVIDAAQDSDHEDNLYGSKPERPGHTANVPQASSKRKKKKKAKATKVPDALRRDENYHVVAVEKSAGIASRPVHHIPQALQWLNLTDALKGKSSVDGRGRSVIAEHKFWETQPVPQLGDQPPAEDGCIEPTMAIADVRQEPYPLPKDLEWAILDLRDPKQIKEVYDLLSLNYVEDSEATFRFKYSTEFLEWALKPPGYRKEWHIGVKVSSNKILVAFISGVPMTVRVRQNVFVASEINYLCVHKTLRSKRLTPVLVQEVARQVSLCGIAQAIYTVALLLPTPVATCQYYHRPINMSKLLDVEFSYVPQNMTRAQMIRLYRIDTETTLPGLREVEERDVPEVADLFTRYMQRFDMVHLMTVDEVRHQLLSGRGDLGQPLENNRRPKQVVWTYVVEDPDTHRVTDFFSFYSLPSTVINNPKHDLLEACYLFYYASEAAFAPGEDTEGKLKKRLEQLIGDALIIANRAKFDVFNALNLMDNMAFFEDLEFVEGTGHLKFYLYNWRTAPIESATADGGTQAGGVGVVML